MSILKSFYLYYFSSTNNAGFVANGNGDVSIFTGTSGSTNRVTVLNTGTLIFNSYINGTLSIINGTGQVSSSSDRRVKEDIVYITDTQTALSHVNNLKPATFKFKDGEGMHLGFIAQDVEQFIPLAVDGKKYEWQWEETEDKKPKFDANGDIVYKVDENGDKIIRPRGLTDRAIIATQTLAIQELSKQNTELTQKLDALSASHAGLQAANAATSSQMAALIAWAQTQGFSV